MAESGEYKVLMCLSAQPNAVDWVEDRIHQLQIAGWICRTARFENHKAMIHLQQNDASRASSTNNARTPE
jgi:hypothetical protein